MPDWETRAVVIRCFGSPVQQFVKFKLTRSTRVSSLTSCDSTSLEAVVRSRSWSLTTYWLTSIWVAIVEQGRFGVPVAPILSWPCRLVSQGSVASGVSLKGLS